MDTGQTKSKKRVADHGEVFTAEREVNAMLDLVKGEAERIDSRFLEPACGNGNFLAAILRRKLQTVAARYKKDAAGFERYAVLAVTSLYGVELLQDNVTECRARLFAIFDAEYTKHCQTHNDDTRAAVRHILARNILCGDALTLKASNGGPIVFAEWSPLNGSLLKRRDFRLDQLLRDKEMAVPRPLFDDLDSYTGVDWQGVQPSLFDEPAPYTKDASGAWVLNPVREFPPVHYREVPKYE